MWSGQNWTEVVTSIKVVPGSSRVNHDAYQIKISAVLYNAGDQITIKEIHFENCNSKRTIGDCDFEDGNSCHWSFNKKSVLPWQISRGTDVNATYAPTTDHTRATSAGHFIWTTFDANLQNQSLPFLPIAILTSVPLDFRVCLSFWFYMDGPQFAQLSVTQSGQPNSTDIATFNKPTVGSWVFKQVDIMWRGATYTVSLEVQIEGPNTTIAIDDILMKCMKSVIA